ncbi:MAG: hypothetical protein U0414_13075 [Polyangiaceae bacterium]
MSCFTRPAAHAATVALVALVAACKAGTSGTGGGGGAGSSTASDGSTSSTFTSTSGAMSTGNFMTGSTSSGGPEQIAEVFGHSGNTLYRLDPDTKAVTTVGNFSGCDGSVIDIALDKDSNLVATTFGGVFKVDRMTAKCTSIQSGSYPNSLSFIPAGTLDPNVEALVGYEGDQYVRIDPQMGGVSPIGSPWGNGLISSGDIVSVKDGPTFLTVYSTNNTCPTDCLVEVDPKTGQMIKNWGPLGYNEVFGIAFWAGSVYGFDSAGDLFEVKFDNGVLSTSAVNAPTGVGWYGAGSTTSAPPIPVPN